MKLSNQSFTKTIRFCFYAAALILGSSAWAKDAPLETLLKALDHQDATTVMGQLQSGIDANTQNHEGQKLLHLAARSGDMLSARALLKYGAEIDGLNRYGETPLMIAAIQGQLEMLKLLHRYGAQINPATDWSPLCYAATGGYLPILEYLVQNGADLDHRCVNGISPLMMAIRQNQPAAALYLLNQGASATDQSADGRSIWQWAKQNDQQEILKKLKALHLDEE